MSKAKDNNPSSAEAFNADSGGGGNGPWGAGGGGGGNRGGRGGGGDHNSPWGQRPPGGGGGGRGPDMPDMEDFLASLFNRLRNLLGGGKDKPPRFGGRAVGFAVIFTALIWLATGFYTVKPNQQGVELVFGKVYDTTAPGLNYNFPTPIGAVLLPSVTSVNQEQIGFRDIAVGNGSIGKRKLTEESLMLTGDENIIDIEFVVFWRIRDAGKYLFNLRNQTEAVKAASEASMREIIGKTDFETARTTGRTQLSEEVKTLIQSILDSYDSGMEIVRVNLQSVDPPEVVLDDFRDVQAARADQERAQNEATAYANEVVEQAQGEAAQITQSAEAYRDEQIAIAEGNAQRFESIYEEYRQNPSVTRRRIYLQNMEEIFGNMDKILIEENSGVLPYLPIDQLRKSPPPTTAEGEN